MLKRKIFLNIIKLIIRKRKVKLNKYKINKVLILRLGAMGDVLNTTPFVKELKKVIPNAKIDYIVSNNVSGILEGNPNINEIIKVSGKDLYGKSISRLITFYKLSRYIKSKKYDLIFNLEPHWLSQFFTLLCEIPISIGFDRFGEGFSLNYKVLYDGKTNEILKYLELLKFFGVKPKNTELEIFLSKHDKDFALNFIKSNNILNKNIIGMSPGAGKNEKAEEVYKRWSILNYKKLCKILVSKGFFLLFFGNKDDKLIVRKIIKGLNKRSYLDTSGKTSIREAVALIDKCNLFIAHDSGPMHIASAMKIPIIALFGPTPPRRFAPLSQNVYIIYKKYKNEPEKYDIFGKFINCEKETYMERITVNDVLDLLNKIIYNKNL